MKKPMLQGFADGKKCPQCHSGLYLPSSTETKKAEITKRVIEKEYELLLNRFRHLLESDLIASYDEVDPRTREYKRNIKELDDCIVLKL